VSGILEAIVASKRARLERGEYEAPPPRYQFPPDGAKFVESLRQPGIRIVAEIKHRSPSAGEILHGAEGHIETIALAYRRGHAAAISVVTEEDHFGGKPDWLTRARRISGLPCLMKDFFLDERQLDFAAAFGSDAVLLIARMLADADLGRLREGARARGMAVVVEAHDEEEIRRAAAVSPDVLGVNARDLASFQTSLDTVAALGPKIPPGPLRLAESGISKRPQIDALAAAGYQAFLVGEAILRVENRDDFLRDLQQ
jgi:indole-3-glycerol phosphate synthase